MDYILYERWHHANRTNILGLPVPRSCSPLTVVGVHCSLLESPMLASLFLILLAIPDEPQKIGIGQPWYDQQKTEESTFEGILDYQPTTGRIGIPAAFAPFRLVRRVGETPQVEQFALQAPGHEAQLASLVGYRVSIVGKVQTVTEGDQKRQTLWVGSVQSLSIAPTLVFTEVKPIARTSKFTANSVKVGTSIGTAVMRSNSDVAKAVGTGTGPDAENDAMRYLKEQFGVKTIDWKTQMVIYIGPINSTRLSTRKLEITKIEVHERGATITWKSDEVMQPGRAPSTDTVLLSRIDGEITFKQMEGNKAEVKATAPAAVEKLIPRAPLK